MVPKHARRVAGFNEAIVCLYAKGLTTGEIRAHLAEIYGVEVSRDLISRVTDRVLEELAGWQSRPLDRIYPVLLVDAIFVKIRDGRVANRPVYVALGINCAGERDVLGLWAGTGGEGAKAWMAMLAELRNRGVEDACIACCDGLKGLPDAIGEIWPAATVQLCVAHLVRASLRYASKKYWGQLSKDLRGIYTAPTEAAADGGSPSLSRPGASAIRRSSGCGVLVEQFTPFLFFRACRRFGFGWSASRLLAGRFGEPVQCAPAWQGRVSGGRCRSVDFRRLQAVAASWSSPSAAFRPWRRTGRGGS